ncbi:TATA element modulatory factor isoform X2 [Belonocnema kinseyi]|uniref:TATA element modulatory factor isoform X2 n=1 Tax=Belonocnema kinseyi TaxID=2817044 RepID=UPI00143D8F73|nr:TATA element modulatory factor isoform X2 [Belonocnema kinseyi]
MSWFDASGFASLAKSALKEAQKTIDKALDIKDEEQKETKAPSAEMTDFFETWGLEEKESAEKKELAEEKESMEEKPNLSQQQTTSIWGSFTGSFFENSKGLEGGLKTMKHSKSFQEFLKDNIEQPHVPSCPSDSASLVGESSNSSNLKNESRDSSFSENPPSSGSILVEESEIEKEEGKTSSEMEKSNGSFEKTELKAAESLKRVSVISCESDKRSSDSVEILGSQPSTDCTTTPESEVNSASQSSPSFSGPKVNSESVEILAESPVTSPSSVEVLGDWKSDTSPFFSPTDEKHFKSSSSDRASSTIEILENESDISPYESPTEEAKTVSSYSESKSRAESFAASGQKESECATKISPDSVKVIADIDESDEISLAEDSYTSASESTVMTIMESFQQVDQRAKEISDSNLKMQDSLADLNSSAEYPLISSLDSIKEKPNLHLPLEPITTQPIRKTDHLESGKNLAELDPFEQLKNSTIEPPEPENLQITKTESVEGPDQYLMLTDSSCEGTLIESSSEDNATLGCAETTITEAPLTASFSVKSMLADAMYEKSDKSENSDTERQCTEVPRENSPISSERSDLVKIGSDQTSGHTSGDELETTTSSDIEIISRYSPNGDSSSTQSRASPAKLFLNKSSDLLTKTLKTRGHSRELSEISVGSDDASLEIEKLLKRIQEMTEILEARESKLIDVSRMNMELHEQNNTLKKQLDNVEKHVEQNDLTQITDEYTQRLSALERKFQQAIRDRDLLRKNLEQLKHETASRLSSMEISTINAEKDEIIKELREEGEKLSKQQLQHSNIIKKLRVKEKENESTMKSQKEQLEEQGLELDRLKRSLYAKEEVERSQIEAVHSLTAKTKKQEKEILSLQEKLDHALNKMDVYKKSLDAAKVELSETKENLTSAEEELKRAVDTAGDSCQLAAQVEDLRMKLRQSEEALIRKEETLKLENLELLRRLEISESRSEEMSESVSSATQPLLRQLEQLQANLFHKTNNFMKQEKIMSEKIMELQNKLENLTETDQTLKEDNLNLKSRVSALESKLHSKEIERAKLEELTNELKLKNEDLAEEIIKHQETIKIMEESHSSQVKELKREINSLENKLLMEKAATDAEKRKNSAILEQQQTVEEEYRLSPTLSIGRDSISSVNSIWPVFNDPMFESSSGRFPNVYESLRAGSSSTSVFENLQSQLKQREGEVQQLQWELSRRNAERDTLNLELSSLSLKVEELTLKVTEVEALNENLNDIRTKYDALLQMYGEKVEENQELLLDLEDVKEMYKTQIDQLLNREAQETK